MANFGTKNTNTIVPIFYGGAPAASPTPTAIPIWPTYGSPSGATPSNNLINLVNYYVNRLIFQYSQQPNAQMLTALMVKQALADDLTTLLINAFDITTAVGPQLDIIGKYVGVKRQINPANATVPYWGFENYSNTGNTIGFRNYGGTTNVSGVWESYSSASQPATNLNDQQYRLVIQLQIILNSNDGTLASIQQYLNDLLPGFVTLIDNQNMTLTYLVNQNTIISSALLQQFLPKPMGVGIIVTIESGSKRVTSDGYTRVTSAGYTRVTSSGT
jgi:hypothetical protein